MCCLNSLLLCVDGRKLPEVMKAVNTVLESSTDLEAVPFPKVRACCLCRCRCCCVSMSVLLCVEIHKGWNLEPGKKTRENKSLTKKKIQSSIVRLASAGKYSGVRTASVRHFEARACVNIYLCPVVWELGVTALWWYPPILE